MSYPVYEAQTIVSIEKNILNDISKGLAMSPSMDSKSQPSRYDHEKQDRYFQVISDLDLDLSKKNEAEMESLIKVSREDGSQARVQQSEQEQR
jgi:hypothetical protein